MVKQNLANRLAAGGFWAIQIAEMSVGVANHLREQGLTPPIGNGSDTDIFIVCGIGAFSHYCNAIMDVIRLNVSVQIEDIECIDKYGEPISREVWSELVRDEEYRRIGLWRSETRGVLVSTVWFGVDHRHRHPPRIFETIIIRIDPQGIAHITNEFGSTTIEVAIGTHAWVVDSVERGQL